MSTTMRKNLSKRSVVLAKEEVGVFRNTISFFKFAK
jgi:hypothetical protein